MTTICKAFAPFERTVPVVGPATFVVVGGKRTSTRPAPQNASMAIITDQSAFRQINPGLIGTGRAVAYIRLSESAAASCQAGALVDGVWEIESVELFPVGTFGKLGGFARLIVRKTGGV